MKTIRNIVLLALFFCGICFLCGCTRLSEPQEKVLSDNWDKFYLKTKQEVISAYKVEDIKFETIKKYLDDGIIWESMCIRFRDSYNGEIDSLIYQFENDTLYEFTIIPINRANSQVLYEGIYNRTFLGQLFSPLFGHGIGDGFLWPYRLIHILFKDIQLCISTSNLSYIIGFLFGIIISFGLSLIPGIIAIGSFTNLNIFKKSLIIFSFFSVPLITLLIHLLVFL